MLDYRVELDRYSGPMDLLLYLVRRHEVDLHDIPIARLAEQYCQHIAGLRQVDVELVGDFLVMASTLLEIKSALLVPPAEASAGDTDTGAIPLRDARCELIQQLLAYKRYKDAAAALEERSRVWQGRCPVRLGRDRGAGLASSPEGESDPVAEAVTIDLEDANMLDLREAFVRVVESIGRLPAYHELVDDETPLALHAEDITDRLERDGAVRLGDLLAGRSNRSQIIGLFLATLELIRQGRVGLAPDGVQGEISLVIQPTANPAEGVPEKPTDWRDPRTGQVQYDWPSERDRLRAERRARLRAVKAAAATGAATGSGPEPSEQEHQATTCDGPSGLVPAHATDPDR